MRALQGKYLNENYTDLLIVATINQTSNKSCQ